MKPNEKTGVKKDNFKLFFLTKNLTSMRTFQDWQHDVLQRLIIVFLGILTLGVLAQSCTTHHSSCAAYDKVEVPAEK